MKLKINKAKAYEALSIAAKAVSSNCPIPALSGIRIYASANGITFTGSDGTKSIRVILLNNEEGVDLTVEDPGCIVIDAKYLLDIFKKLDSETVSIEILDGSLTHFAGEKSQFKINGYRPSDYPAMQFDVHGTEFNISCEVLTEMISQVAIACANKETRPVLTGVNIVSDGEQIKCVATDSFRLGKRILSVQTGEFNVTVPVKALNEIKGIFNAEDTITVSANEREITFRSGNTVLKSTLLDGNYPEVDHLIPTSFVNYIIVDRKQLLSAIDRASFLKTDGMSLIRLDIEPGKDMILSSYSSEIGEFRETVPVELGEDRCIAVSFIGSYLVDALKSLDSDKVRISYNEAVKPFILTNEGSDKELIELVLPIRTFN